MAVTRDEVRTAAIRAFPREDAETVMAILDLYGVGPHERERERVQFDILILSASDPDLLLHYVGIAKQDYRDILFWAEYPEEARADPAEVRRLLAWLSAQAHTKRAMSGVLPHCEANRCTSSLRKGRTARHREVV